MSNELKYWHNGLPFIGSPRNYFDLGTFNFMYDGVLPFEVPDTYSALHPDADTSGGSWINQGGLTSPLYSSIDEVTPQDNDFIQSQQFGNTCKISLSNPYGTVSAPFVINYRLGFSTPFSSASIRVRLLQGTTEIARWLHFGLSTTQTSFSQTLTASQYAAITDFTDLYLEFWSYLGPGDIVGPAVGWWGLRAYRADKIGVPVIRLRRAFDNAEQDFSTLGDGSLDVASIFAWGVMGRSPDVGGLSPDALFVRTLYDQTGNGQDLVQATSANQVIFTLNGIGTLPIMQSTGSPLELKTSATMTARAQPFSTSLIYNKPVSGDSIAAAISGALQIRPGVGGVNTCSMWSGSFLTGAAVNNSWHAVQTVSNGTTSDIIIDGTSNVGDAGTNTIAAAVFAALFSDGSGTYFAGSIVEYGIWYSGFTATQKAAMNTNQHTYWGF